MGDSVYTRQQFWGSFEPKIAELGGVAPSSAPPNTKPDKGAKHTILKTGSAEPPDDNYNKPVVGAQPEKNPQALPMNPRVDVTNKEPPKILKEKQAQHLAMPSIGRYPLDSYSDVKTASVYFEQHKGSFDPAHRREYCYNLVKRAHALGIEVSDDVQKYGSDSYASYAEIKIALDSRRTLVNEEHGQVLDKLAEMRPTMDPSDFALTLGEFDKVAGIQGHYDGEVMDPFYSTFGKEAEADEDTSFVIGNDYVSAAELRGLAASPHREILKEPFGEDFLKEYMKDPIGIFKSLPADQQKVLARHANGYQTHVD